MIDIDRLAALAAELAVRVRDETPDDNAAWFDQQRLDLTGYRDLCIVLAAAIPDDRPWLALTAWKWAVPARSPEIVDEGEVLRPDPRSRPKPTAQPEPCGTPAAAKRHRYHGEEICPPCLEAERAWHRNYKRDIRKAEQRGRAAA